MRIIAIDPSMKCTGVCFTDDSGEYALFSVKREKNESKYEYWDRVKDALEVEFAFGHKTDLIVIEDYAYAANTRGLTQLAEIGGIIRYVMYGLGICDAPILDLPNTTWKAVALGRGNMNKKDVAIWAEKKFEVIWDNQDEADAFLMLKAIEIAAATRYVSKARTAADRLRDTLFNLGLVE